MKIRLVEDTKIEVENPGLLEVPEGKKVYDLPVSHFKKLIDKKGREKVVRALTNLQVWNKNDDPKITSWAKKMKKSLEGYGEKKLKESYSNTTYRDLIDLCKRVDSSNHKDIVDEIKAEQRKQDAFVDDVADEKFTKKLMGKFGFAKNESLKESRKKTDERTLDRAFASAYHSLKNGATDSQGIISGLKMIYNLSYDEALNVFREAHNEFMSDKENRWEVDSSRDDWDEENESLKEKLDGKPVYARLPKRALKGFKIGETVIMGRDYPEHWEITGYDDRTDEFILRNYEDEYQDEIAMKDINRREAEVDPIGHIGAYTGERNPYENESLKESADNSQKIREIESQIKRLVDKYSRLQKQYHGDSAASRRVEEEIDGLEIELRKLKSEKEESLKESSLNEEHTMVREEEEELDNAIKEAIHQTQIVSQTHEDRETRMLMRKVRELLKQARELY